MGLAPGSPVLFDRLGEALARMSPLIEERRKSGKVRRGHGDLHLRNICIYEGKPLAFDALEFDEALATTDLLYDFAFLLMDLRRVGLAEHANAAMNRYWDITGEEEEALQLLPFFMSLRAAVRMAVAVEAGELQEAQTYRALGLALIERAAPLLVAIGGLSGTGKTAVAQALAPQLPGPAGARLLRSDVLRKAKLGVSLKEKAQEACYAPERQAEIYRDLAAKSVRAIQGGASVVADATFRVGSTREAIAAAAQSAPFFAYWLAAPLSVRLARVGRRSGDASDADVRVASEQTEPADISLPWRRLDANRPISVIVEDIMNDLAAGRARPAR
jgi:predicted kinase